MRCVGVGQDHRGVVDQRRPRQPELVVLREARGVHERKLSWVHFDGGSRTTDRDCARLARLADLEDRRQSASGHLRRRECALRVHPHLFAPCGQSRSDDRLQAQQRLGLVTRGADQRAHPCGTPSCGKLCTQHVETGDAVIHAWRLLIFQDQRRREAIEGSVDSETVAAAVSRSLGRPRDRWRAGCDPSTPCSHRPCPSCRTMPTSLSPGRLLPVNGEPHGQTADK